MCLFCVIPAGINGVPAGINGVPSHKRAVSLGTLAQSVDIMSGGPNGPNTFTGLITSASPIFPFPYPSVVAAMPSPDSDAVGTQKWLQGFATGARACILPNTTTLLQSVAVVGLGGSDWALVANATVRECALPIGGNMSCFSQGIIHVEPFAAPYTEVHAAFS